MPPRNYNNDSELIDACIAQDAVAWSVFTEKYSRLIDISIKNRLFKYGFNVQHHDMEDIKQDVLIALWSGKKLTEIRNKNNISYWLAIVSGNMAIGYLRRKRIASLPNTLSLSSSIEGLDPCDIIPSPAPNLIEELISKYSQNRIDLAIEALPDIEKLIAKLNIIHGKKYREIADILSLPSGTVSSYIKRAKEKLRKSLKNLQ